MCPTRHFVYIFFNPVFQVSTAKNEINLLNNHILIVAPVTFAPAGAMTPSAEFLLFFLHLVTVDETLVHNYEPENKAQSRQWVGPGSRRPKKFKTQPSAGKVMATVFWNAKGFIMLDSLPKRSTITGVFYANLLDQL